MKIAIASDHRGFKLKNTLIDFLKAKGYEVFD
ncbi:MAG: RpiB/LacA/LacB family sugar-phosphate isomerase, partial [Candidatus Omnitrophica bacterium]|nr:RpiB/LacA/LacB family sugar-phosphate isomerase [Candidatus Omnitrophota bacterium]